MAPNTELFRLVATEHRFLCVGDPEDRQALSRHGVLAGPLVDPVSGEAFGMLKVEQLPFMDLGSQAVESFRATCGWIGTVLADVRRRRHAGDAWLTRDHASAMERAAIALQKGHER